MPVEVQFDTIPFRTYLTWTLHFSEKSKAYQRHRGLRYQITKSKCSKPHCFKWVKEKAITWGFLHPSIREYSRPSLFSSPRIRVRSHRGVFRSLRKPQWKNAREQFRTNWVCVFLLFNLWQLLWLNKEYQDGKKSRDICGISFRHDNSSLWVWYFYNAVGLFDWKCNNKRKTMFLMYQSTRFSLKKYIFCILQGSFF